MRRPTKSLRLPDVRIETQRPLRNRAMRSPSHTFRLKTRPWQIVPAFIAPVLAGDTVKGYSVQARVLSDPIKDKLAGWWNEFFVFYVRIGDLDAADREEFQNLMINGTGTPDSWGTSTAYYQLGGGVDLIQRAYDRVVKCYFRSEDHPTYPQAIGDYAAAMINGKSWWDSIVNNDMLEEPVTTDPELWDSQWSAYEQMRNAKLTTATWAEYLAMQGVSTPVELNPTDPADRRPELLRFVRDFQYPVQAVEPSTGVPSALVQWSIADRMKGTRFCAEPGVLIGISVSRPKAYMKNQNGNATAYLMDKPEAWLPTALESDPHTTLRMFDGVGTVGGAGSGPVYGAYDDYWINSRDLLQRGDQFVNFDLRSTVAGAQDNANIVDLPKITDGVNNPAFPSETDADACFSGDNKSLHIDGIITLHIASRAGVKTTRPAGY